MIELNKIYNEDCLNTMSRIERGSVDLILQDLPYGNTNLIWDKKINLNDFWKEWLRIIKVNGALAFFSMQPFTTDLILSNRKLFRYEIVWKKTQPLGFLDAKKRPLRCHENILIFFRKQPTFNPQKTFVKRNDIGRVRKMRSGRAKHYDKMCSGQYIEDGSRYPIDVVEFSNWNGTLFGRKGKSVIHPTQKPIDLVRYLIRTYSNENEIIYDGFSGSGTTAIAAIKENRRFVCAEINEEYYRASQQRLEYERAQGALVL